MGQPSNPTISTTSRRRSQRVLMQVGIVVYGTDTMNRRFEEETETLSINAHGALILLGAKLASGAKVVVKHKKTQEEQECSVVFLGSVRGRRPKWVSSSPSPVRPSGAWPSRRKTGRRATPTRARRTALQRPPKRSSPTLRVCPPRGRRVSSLIPALWKRPSG